MVEEQLVVVVVEVTYSVLQLQAEGMSHTPVYTQGLFAVEPTTERFSLYLPIRTDRNRGTQGSFVRDWSRIRNRKHEFLLV